ncbi:hypothetical protein NDU88_010507 [Pleurodeles waltl]|uniref:Uncharacterized protein n=1 Tax=Pleurodeles waltl TaxID=8319 RepID=A0AAV7PVY1_PLEWA|nr:hypothetical protein NDU88_010507 [Pleurodeles waltl]
MLSLEGAWRHRGAGACCAGIRRRATLSKDGAAQKPRVKDEEKSGPRGCLIWKITAEAARQNSPERTVRAHGTRGQCAGAC